MAQNVQIGELADAIMETLEEYADLAADNVKQAVKDAGETVKKEIRANAPKDTGDYAKSWAVKKSKETSNSITMTVYSRNRYYLAHLLEFGHAKRNGGRVAGKNHIAPAEEKGIQQLEEEVERSLRDG
ncbi:MAG TPA: HK97 gp10 family phage protein [Candidatus Blautia intestinipullorum]|nr:HK97 gp10 family phage protein [Candidatus Blautia intestinipullorum]